MSDELVPLPDQIRALPAPRDVGRALRDALSARVAAERERRGEVHLPEDVNPLVRSLAGSAELLGEYARAFTGAATIAKEELEEELIAAVGEQDGIPTANLTVPDLDGTNIRLVKNMNTSHQFDQSSIIAAVIGSVMDAARGSEPPPPADAAPPEEWDAYVDGYERWVMRLMERAIDIVLSLGSYSPQVTKVRAFSNALAAQGDDAVAGAVSTSITSKAEYRGVKMERVERKT